MLVQTLKQDDLGVAVNLLVLRSPRRTLGIGIGVGVETVDRLADAPQSENHLLTELVDERVATSGCTDIVDCHGLRVSVLGICDHVSHDLLGISIFNSED